MLKKILKIVGVIIVLFVVALFAIPYFFKDEIKAKIAITINESVDAKVSFADADLSLFKNFSRGIMPRPCPTWVSFQQTESKQAVSVTDHRGLRIHRDYRHSQPS